MPPKQTLKDDPALSKPTREFLELYSDERIAHLTRLCARGFNRSLARRLSDHGISFGQWIFLRILWKSEGLTQRELSERANLTAPTVHTAMGKLEHQGIVTRRTEDGNKRKQHVYLTAQGKALQSILEPLAFDANVTALEGLSVEEEDSMKHMLIHILHNLTEDEANADARGQRIPPTRGSAE